MKTRNYLLLLFLLVAGFVSAQNFMNSEFLKAKYTKVVVWDAQRSPAYPSMGGNWTLSGLQPAFDVSTGGYIDWGRNNDRYIKFSVMVDNSNGIETLADDVANSGRKYKVMLRLYEANNVLVKTISNWGQLIGFGSGGFMYVQEGQVGTYFSGKVMQAGGTITYRADLDKVHYISAILDEPSTGSTATTGNTRTTTSNRGTGTTSSNRATGNIASSNNTGNTASSNNIGSTASSRNSGNTTSSNNTGNSASSRNSGNTTSSTNNTNTISSNNSTPNFQSDFFDAKYVKNDVWDAQRSPAFPIKDRNWTLSGLKMAFDVNSGTTLDWGRNNDRYVMFNVEKDFSNNMYALADDVQNSGQKYNVTLKLYERDGRLVKTISKWGRLIGVGPGGFMYVQEGRAGTFFASEAVQMGRSITYRAEIDKVLMLSSVVYRENNASTSNNNSNNNNSNNYSNNNNSNSNNSGVNFKSDFFTAKYPVSVVWDAQRFPAYPVNNRSWTLSDLKMAFDVNTGGGLDWGRNRDRYLMFSVEEDRTNSPDVLRDDVRNSSKKYRVVLKLYEGDGRLVKVVSRWGKLMGFGSGGFMYEQEGQVGTYFAAADLRLGGSNSYKIEVDQIRDLSSIIYEENTSNSSNQNNNNNNNNSYNNSHNNNNYNYASNNSANIKSDFFDAQYPMGIVWDAQRFPAYPVNGRSWSLTDLKMAFDVNTGGTLDWGRNRDRYLKFDVEENRNNYPDALKDDVNNTNKRYNVTLKLYESDGRLVKVVSRWGKLIGFGTGGFMYEQEGQVGTYIAGEVLRLGGSINYNVELDQVRDLSAIVYTENKTNNTQNQGNRTRRSTIGNSNLSR